MSLVISKLSTPRSCLLNTIGFLFIIGIVACHATMLRFAQTPIGLGELFIALALLLTIIKMLVSVNFTLSFSTKVLLFYWFFTLCLLGLGFFVSRNLAIGSESAIHNAIAILFVAFFSIGISIHFGSGQKMEKMLLYVSIVFLLFQLSIFIAAKTQYSPFGMELFSANNHYRFEGFADNPNQLALYFCCIPFVFIALYRTGNCVVKMCSIVAVLLTFYLGYQTKSDALLLSWCIGTVAFILITSLTKSRVSMYWQPALAITSILLLSVLLFFFAGSTKIYSGALSAIEGVYYGEGGQGAVRVGLWRNGLVALMESPFTGLGPGSFSGIDASFNNTESHNTIIDWSLQVGVVGLLLLVIFVSLAFINTWRRGRIDLMSGLLALVVFAQFHYILRQPLAWVVILWALSANEQPRRNSAVLPCSKGE